MVLGMTTTSEKFRHFKAKKKWYRRFCKRSSVAIILNNASLGLEVLMIKRAQREGDPWSGHMGFPGGRAEKIDNTILETARRETWEEIGLQTDTFTQHIGRLSDILARPYRGQKPMVVTPHVFTLTTTTQFSINHEVDEIIWVPLDFLIDENNRENMVWQTKNMAINLPCYHYQKKKIWGMSLKMLDELISVVTK